MKIFAISDLHGNLDGIDPAGNDIVIIAGDIAPLHGFSKQYLLIQKNWIETDFFNWTSKYPDIEFVVIPGNHDMCLDAYKMQAWPELIIAWPKNVHLLINSGIKIKGVNVWGSPNVPIISHTWAFESESTTLKREFSKIPDNIDILITHTPPRLPNKYIDVSMQYYGYSQPFGSCELTDEIMAKRPKYVFCGHIHTGDHTPTKFGDTTVFNVSRLDETYKIAYEPTVIDL